MKERVQQIAVTDEAEGLSTGSQAGRIDLNLLDLSKATEPEALSCSERIDIKELSKVGPISSAGIDSSAGCKRATHPSDKHEFRTWDSRDGSEKTLKLTDLFDKRDIYSALMKDKIVQGALSSENLRPQNFEELQKLLSRNDGQGISVYQNRPNRDPLDIHLNKNILSNFAFHHIEGDKIAVRLLPDYGSEAARNQKTQLAIVLPIPRQLREAFSKADKGNAGFLMKDSKQKGKSASSFREFHR